MVTAAVTVVRPASHAVGHPHRVDRHDDRGVVQALARDQAEHLLVDRRCDGRHTRRGRRRSRGRAPRPRRTGRRCRPRARCRRGSGRAPPAPAPRPSASSAATPRARAAAGRAGTRSPSARSIISAVMAPPPASRSPPADAILPGSRTRARGAGTGCPRSVTNSIVGSGAPGALTNDTKRSSFAGSSSTPAPLVGVARDVRVHGGLQVGADAEGVVDDHRAQVVEPALHRLDPGGAVRCSRSAVRM